MFSEQIADNNTKRQILWISQNRFPAFLAVRRVCDAGVSSVPAQTFHRKQAIIGRWQKLPRRLIGVSALPCETENREIASFHLNVVSFFASKHTKHIKTITYGHRQTILHSWDDQLYAANKTIQPSDMHTVGVHHVCHDIGRHVSCGSLFRLTLEYTYNGRCQWHSILHE